MLRRPLLKAHQWSVFVDMPVDEESLIRHCTLDRADLDLVLTKRTSHNRLGLAIQLCFLRQLGRSLFPGELPPAPMLAFVAQQIGTNPSDFVAYGRQSGTSGSPSILNAAPEAAAHGGLALLRTGDRVRVDLRRGVVNVLIGDAELAERRAALEAAGGFAIPASQTPWQAIQRAMVGQLNTGAILEGAEKYQTIAQTMGVPRDNH